MNRGLISKACSLFFALTALSTCSKQSAQTAPPEQAATERAASSTEQRQDGTTEEVTWRCPNRVHGSVVSSVRTKRGINVLFSAPALPARPELQRRAGYLVAMYNSVYGEEGERTSWAKWNEAPDGARVEFSIFTEPDLDPRVEPVPEQSEVGLRELRERIDDYVVRMQAGETCPIMRDLAALGAPVPSPLAQEPI